MKGIYQNYKISKIHFLKYKQCPINYFPNGDHKQSILKKKFNLIDFKLKSPAVERVHVNSGIS